MKKLLNRIKSISSITILMIFILNFVVAPPVANAASIRIYAPSSVKATASNYNSINISWRGVSGASGYEVYRATSSSGTYTLISRGTALSFYNTGLTTGRTYYYKVRAYRITGTKTIYSSYSYKSSSKPIAAAPAPTAASSSYTSINVSWGGVPGASGYEVYRATSSRGYYSLISRTTALNYNNTGLTSGRIYYYKVRAYSTIGRSRIYGGYSSIVNSKPVPAAPVVTAAGTSQTSVNVSWSRVAGASGYEVYKADLSNGSYSLVSTTTSTNFVNTGLFAGTTYYYKVRAYRILGKVKLYGDFSAYIGGTTAPINVTSISLNKTASDLLVGGTDTLLAVIAPENATNKAIKWTSSDNNIAVVDASGKVTAVGAGTATITAATVDGNKTASYTVTVTQPFVNVASVSLNKPSMTLVLGFTDILKPVFYPSNATNQAVTWTSSDNTIATVDNTGKVTPLKEGTVIITVTTVDGGKTANSTVTVTTAVARGIDVSKWQGTIDWGLVKGDGVQFAMLRSSYGDGSSRFSNNGTDPMFETYYAGAKASGMPVGAYHYSYATTVDQAVTEANFFISKLQGKQFEYPVCVDIEDPSQSGLDQKTLTDIAITYLEMLKQAGYYPMIYASKYWFTTELDDTRLTSYDHWLAQYANSMTYPGQAGMWQYTSSGIVNGISSRVDMDVSFFDYATKIKSLYLNGFVAPTPVPVPEPVPTPVPEPAPTPAQ